MATPKSTNIYLTQSVMTASPARLVAMLFDRAISSLKEAVRAIEEHDIETRWRANNRAIDIITHLEMTLDLERGGEIAENLNELYKFILNRLPRIDMKNDAQTAQEIIGLLEPLRQSWHELADRGAGAPVVVPAVPSQAPGTAPATGGQQPVSRISVSA